MNDERKGPAPPVDAHAETIALLPWFVTGALEPDEHARVAAHIAVCAECQAEAALEARLEHAVAGLPLQLETGWAEMRQKLAADVDVKARPARAREPWLGWGMAASLAVVAAVSGYAVAPRDAAKTYHTLASAEAPPNVGNVIVIFRPDLRESEMRAVLNANHARMVEGPTAADAWVLRVPAAERAAALQRLRGDAGVVLAQPIDPAPSP